MRLHQMLSLCFPPLAALALGLGGNTNLIKRHVGEAGKAI